jgi:hypothetical protein
LNNRPRKRLGFKTPAEVFHQSLKRVVLRTWIRLGFIATTQKIKWLVCVRWYLPVHVRSQKAKKTNHCEELCVIIKALHSKFAS